MDIISPFNKLDKMTGKLFLIVGPSGSGKGTVIRELQKKYRGFVYPISYTTRQPRDGEHDGEVYHFITKDKFKQMIAEGDFLEYATVHSDNFYGTAKKEILDALEGGAVVVREVDMQGFHSIRNLVPGENLVSIFMKVTSEADLRGRILRRGEISEDELNKRMESARREIAQSGDCNYQVENEWGHSMRCVTEVEKIVMDEIKDLY